MVFSCAGGVSPTVQMRRNGGRRGFYSKKHSCLRECRALRPRSTIEASAWVCLDLTSAQLKSLTLYPLSIARRRQDLLVSCCPLKLLRAPTESPSARSGIWGLSRPQGATPRRCRGCCATGAKLHCIISTPPALGLGKVAAVGGGVQVPWLVTVRYLRAAALRGDEWSRLFDHFGQ